MEENRMRAAVYHTVRDVRVVDVPDPEIVQPTDAVVRITHASICGSDLWAYRGIDPTNEGTRLGHEWIGVVAEVGSEVHTVKRGDRVIAPFFYTDGTCKYCQQGFHVSCTHGGVPGGGTWSGLWGMNDGGLGEAIRVPYADGTLVKLPASVEGDTGLLKALLPLTDVMTCGYHAAVIAGVTSGSTVVVIGDGAVGLSGVLAAKYLGAERIIMMGHRPQRLEVARQFGVTDIITSRGDEAIHEVVERTNGGAPHIIECVGSTASINAAIQVAYPGGTVGLMGLPHTDAPLDLMHVLFKNINLRGGATPVRAYLPDLVQTVLQGKLNPSPLLDTTVDLDGVPEGYNMMDERKALKVMVQVSA
jgi:threonine dehydrogenase-like Zn-dependent dehydrogenase